MSETKVKYQRKSSVLRVVYCALVSLFLLCGSSPADVSAQPESPNSLTNFRRPANDTDLRYWLENMVWYHYFTNEEITVATGLTDGEIDAALKKFD